MKNAVYITGFAVLMMAGLASAETTYFNPGDYLLRCVFDTECRAGETCTAAEKILTLEHKEEDGPLATVTFADQSATEVPLLTHYAAREKNGFSIFAGGDPEANVSGDAMIYVTIQPNLLAFYASHSVDSGDLVSITRTGACENLGEP